MYIILSYTYVQLLALLSYITVFVAHFFKLFVNVVKCNTDN